MYDPDVSQISWNYNFAKGLQSSYQLIATQYLTNQSQESRDKCHCLVRKAHIVSSSSLPFSKSTLTCPQIFSKAIHQATDLTRNPKRKMIVPIQQLMHSTQTGATLELQQHSSSPIGIRLKFTMRLIYLEHICTYSSLKLILKHANLSIKSSLTTTTTYNSKP